MTYVQKSIIALTLIVTLALPSIASAHHMNTTIAWRKAHTSNLAHKHLYAHKIPNHTYWYKIIMNIAKEETGATYNFHIVGNESGDAYYGIGQFNRNWHSPHDIKSRYHSNWRFDEDLAIHKIVQTIKTGGLPAVKRAWTNTWR